MSTIHECFDTCETWCYETQPKCEKHGQIPSHCSSCWYEAQPKCRHEEISTNCLKCKY